MIKKLFLFLFTAILINEASAQEELMIDSFATRNFSGVVRSQNAPFSLVFCTVTEKDKTFLKGAMFNPALGQPTMFKYPVSKTTLVFAGAALDRGTLFIIGDPATKKRSVVLIDNKGKVVSEKSEDVSADLLNKSLPYYVFKGMPQGAMAVMPMSSKTGTCKFVKYGDDMAILWSKELKSDKGSFFILNVENEMDRITLLCKESKGGESTYSLRSLNVDQGDVVTDNPFKEGDNHMFPLFASPRMGMTITAGPYYKDGKYDDKTQSGIFAAVSGPDGRMMQSASLPYEKLQKFLSDATIRSINNGARIAVVGAAVTQTNTLDIVCELFEKTGGSDAMVTVSDLFLIRLDEQREIASLKYMPGIHPNVARVNGDVAAMSTQDAMAWFYKHRFFHTKYVLSSGPNNYIGYTNIDSGIVSAQVVLADSFNAKSVKILPGATSNKIPDLEKVNGEYVFDASPAPGELYKWQYFDCMKLEPEMRVMTYNLAAPRLIIKMMPGALLR